MKLPIGIEDFAMLRQNNYYFVDKSLFIKDLLDRSPKVLVMTRPPRFGKSLLLSMLKYFFSSEYGKGNRHLFDGLAIEQAGSQYMDEQGEKPVVMISLKECRGTTWAQMLENLKSKMAALYQQYMFLMKNKAIRDVERRYFTAICNKSSNTASLEISLQQLL
ncbi:MAG: AAA family ATPase [Selenomonas sp.]|nr:AAA family ATPase [Selenomonas sp.]